MRGRGVGRGTTDEPDGLRREEQVLAFGDGQTEHPETEEQGHPEGQPRPERLREVGQGETQEQLLESLGRPEDIDKKVLKTKTKEIWKYRKTARNRFGLKVTLDDGIVTGWEQND